MSRNGPISRELTLNHQDTKSTKAAELSPAHDVTARQIVDSAFTVHTTLGPGLLESVYEQCLERELRFRDLMVARQVALPLTYRGEPVDAGFRIDMLVSGLVVVEIKAIEKLLPIHEAQLLTYLKLSGKRLGLSLISMLFGSGTGFSAWPYKKSPWCLGGSTYLV